MSVRFAHAAPFASFSCVVQCKEYVYPNNRAAFHWFHDHT
jgi:hypothetical protein